MLCFNGGPSSINGGFSSQAAMVDFYIQPASASDTHGLQMEVSEDRNVCVDLLETVCTIRKT